MSKFNELFDLLKKENDEKISKKNGKRKGVPFSRGKFTNVAQGLLNDPDYEVEIIKTKNNEFVTESINPIKDFRKSFIEKVLVDNGVDKVKAAQAASKYNYSNKQVDALYPVISEGIDQYMRLGHTFRFMDKKDFTASISMSDVKGSEKSYRNPNKGNDVVTRIDDHKVLIKKSGAPRICKHRVDK